MPGQIRQFIAQELTLIGACLGRELLSDFLRTWNWSVEVTGLLRTSRLPPLTPLVGQIRSD